MNNMITENICGFEIKFQTRAGVFSKEGVDIGSKLLLEHSDIRNKSLIADLGCGAGVIGMVSALKNPDGWVHLLDVNLRTINLAKENVELNRLKNAEVYLSDLFSGVGERTYDQILSNPPLHLGNDFLEETASECYKHLKEGGRVLWVVQKHLKPFIERLFDSHFGNSKTVVTGVKHVVIEAQKIK